VHRCFETQNDNLKKTFPHEVRFMTTFSIVAFCKFKISSASFGVNFRVLLVLLQVNQPNTFLVFEVRFSISVIHVGSKFLLLLRELGQVITCSHAFCLTALSVIPSMKFNL